MSLKELVNGLGLHHIVGEVANSDVANNLINLSAGQHTMFTYHANDAENTVKMFRRMLLLDKDIYYKAGYTDAINNTTMGYELSADNEKFYMDGFLCGLADRENNTVDDGKLLTDAEKQALEEFKDEL